MSLSLRIGSRRSPLAKIQVQEVLSLAKNISFEYQLIEFSTQGDLDQTSSLMSMPADDFFTNTLDEALLKQEIDIAIHSAKDLPKTLNENLKIYALTRSLDESDSWVSNYALEELPEGAKVGTSSVLRAKMIKAIRPNITLVDIRGTIEQRLEQLKNKKIDGLIIATCALKRLGLNHLIKSILPWPTTALQGQLAIVGRKNNWQVEKLFESIDARKNYGDVFLVGAGPGDPELITVKAINTLKHAQCVFYDYLVDPSLLKYAPNAEHIYVGKRKGHHTLPQEKLSLQLKEKAMQGKTVVRLKGGDPLVFGRGADEISFLSSYHIKVHVIPGISSATSIPSSLGIPLTARGISSSVSFLSGYSEVCHHQDSQEIKIPQTDTIVFLMGLTKLNEIVNALLKAGWSKLKPIMIISNGTKPNEKKVVGRLDNIEKLAFSAFLESPSLIVAGDIVNFYRTQPIKTLLHCGTHPEKYNYLGQILPWPMIQIEPISLDKQAKTQLIQDFDQSDFVILTSPNAVEHFIRIILTLKSAHSIRQKIFAVIGRSTAETLEEFGLAAQIISPLETSQGLYNLISKIIKLEGKTILLPRSSLPNPFLKSALESNGAFVKEWTIYQNIKTPSKPLPTKPIDGVIFTSPSTFQNFLLDYGTIPDSWQIFAKGPVTAKTLQEAGYEPYMVNI